MHRSMLVCILTALAALPASANDGVAELAGGGLVFVNNQDVEMRSEDLFISQKEIRVRYSFVNNSNRDVTLLVAFPFPDLRAFPDEPLALPDRDSEQFIPFSTTADGRPTKTEVEQKAYALGIDRTDTLRRLGIPLAPHLKTTRQALDRLSKTDRDELISLGIAQIDVESLTGGGTIEHLWPRWTLKTTHFWRQTFPAKRETIITHRYAPSLGTYLASVLDTRLLDKNDKEEVQKRTSEIQEHRNKYCINDEFSAAVMSALEAAGEDATPIEHSITYILSTASTWAGYVKDFRLIVDKGSPDTFVSFCGTDIRQISPVQYEMRKQDFNPTGDLQVLFLEVHKLNGK